MASDLLMILVCVALQSIGQLTLKYGMAARGPITSSDTTKKVVTSFLNPFVLLGFGLFAATSLLWIVVLSRVEVSWAFPMVSLSYVVVLICSHFFLGETVSRIRLLGTLIICGGVFLVSLS